MPTGHRPDPSQASRLRLVTLGRVSLRDDAEPEAPLLEIGKPLALVAYLACAPDRTGAREHLIDLLWGDVEQEAAKHALRQTLWYLKKRLGDRPLVAGGDRLAIMGPLDCDRDAVVNAAARGDHEAVVRLYTGDFFPGFAAPGGVEFERWADAERQRLRSIFWRSAEVLARQWMSAARMKDAQALARRVRDLDPLREAGWRLMFEAIIAGSDAVAATMEVEAFERVFGGEGIEPEPATRALLRALRQSPTPGDGPDGGGSRALVAELVGREHEFACIIDAWETARAGNAAHVHLQAPAGLGKTRLLTDVHARLRATRARTVFVRATLGARDIPYGLVGELALALARLPGASGISPGSARTLVALNPAVSSSFPSAADVRDDPSDALRRRTAALRELIVVLAEEQPLAVFIDDLQWGDVGSRQVLAGLHGTLGGARALVVTAGRPTAEIVHTPDVSEVVHLAPLSKAAVGALLASIATLPAESWAEHLPTELWQATSGSPLLILETLQLALERGSLHRVDGEWHAPKPYDVLAAMRAGSALRHRVERLERADRWLLTLLAVAGSPQSTDVVAGAADRSTDDVALALVALEQRGLVARQGELWSPSHDEIAAMAIELANDAAVRAAARTVGRALVSRYRTDLRSLRQAGMLLDRAQDQAGLAHAFGLFARASREAGDLRDNYMLAREFIGDRMQALTRWLVRSLPLTHRFGMYSTRRQLAAAAGVVALPLLFAAVRVTLGTAAPPPPEAILLVGTIAEDSLARIYHVPIRSAELAVGQLIEPRIGNDPAWVVRADPQYPSFVERPDGQGILFDRVASDSGGIDVWEVTQRGERRLTSTHGDDQAASVSPDGRYIAYHTAQWDERSRYDLAILDRQTGVTRQLTKTGDSDTSPAWSPDGSRIAFFRTYWDGRRGTPCVVNFDGTNTRCFPEATDAASLRYWYDYQELLVRIRRGDREVLARLNVETGRVDSIAVIDGAVNISPDARWVACQCPRIGFGSGAYLIFPIDAPNRAVEVDLSALQPGQPFVGWGTLTHRATYADSLTIDAGRGPALVGVSHALSAVGVAPKGDSVAVGSVAWASLDTTVAVIDSLGILIGRRAGTVEVEASAGGWRSTRRRITVEERRTTTVLHETWARGITVPWRRFGEPEPRIESAPDGTPAMMNNGEGSHSSGVYTEREHATARGLALDARVSAPINEVQWQTISVELGSYLSVPGLARWDHRTGGLPRLPGSTAWCHVRYPGSYEGKGWGDSLQVGAANERFTVAAPSVFKTGQWFDVRVQLFPDGRCGFAINGVPLIVSAPRAIWQPTVRVMLYGNSAWTNILVGETTLREGVPDDIDWNNASLGSKIPDRPTHD